MVPEWFGTNCFSTQFVQKLVGIISKLNIFKDVLHRISSFACARLTFRQTAIVVMPANSSDWASFSCLALNHQYW